MNYCKIVNGWNLNFQDVFGTSKRSFISTIILSIFMTVPLSVTHAHTPALFFCKYGLEDKQCQIIIFFHRTPLVAASEICLEIIFLKKLHKRERRMEGPGVLNKFNKRGNAY